MPTASVTAPTDAADDIATPLVEERLAACVKEIECTSTYRWIECTSTYRWSDDDGGDATDRDAIQRDDEVVLLAKTTSDRYEARVRELRPYDVPSVERFDEAGMLDGYANWVADATTPED